MEIYYNLYIMWHWNYVLCCITKCSSLIFFILCFNIIPGILKDSSKFWCYSWNTYVKNENISRAGAIAQFFQRKQAWSQFLPGIKTLSVTIGPGHPYPPDLLEPHTHMVHVHTVRQNAYTLKTIETAKYSWDIPYYLIDKKADTQRH